MKAVLNLCRGFSQEGNEISNTTSIFPGGEVYANVKVPDWVTSVRINTRFEGSDDIMRVALMVDSLRRQGVAYIDLFIPYLPYSRQDRVCEKGDSFSLKVMCQLLSSCAFNRIFTYDAHSNVAEVLLDNLWNYNNHREVSEFMNLHVLNNVVLIVPDLGAAKKARVLFEDNDRITSIVQCNKTRVNNCITIDKIKDKIYGKTVLVVDDICDGGGTFIELGKKLEQAKVHNAFLFVSHGIFSAGFDMLKDYYHAIGTTNSIKESRDPKDCRVFPIIY